MTADFLHILKIWELVAIPVMFGLAFVLRYFYTWCQGAAWAAPFGVVRESLWEHVKLLFWPALMFGVLEFFCLGSQVPNFWLAKGVALSIGLVFLLAGYKVYELFVKPHCFIGNVLLLLVADALTQHFSYYFMEKLVFAQVGVIWGPPLWAFWAVLIIIWTFQPPRLPWFQGKAVRLK